MNLYSEVQSTIYRSIFITGGEFGSFAGHSLSWSSEKVNHYGSVMVARVWTPEDPRSFSPNGNI